MDVASISVIAAIAVGIGICAAVGLLSARAAKREESVDRPADETPKPPDRHR